jgi:hypothetical protein
MHAEQALSGSSRFEPLHLALGAWLHGATPFCRIRRRLRSGSHVTHCWGEQDSNPRSRGLTPTYRILMRPEVGSASYPSGEAAQGPAAAIANALADAAGVRVREVPLTAQRVKAAIGI